MRGPPLRRRRSPPPSKAGGSSSCPSSAPPWTCPSSPSPGGTRRTRATPRCRAAAAPRGPATRTVTGCRARPRPPGGAGATTYVGLGSAKLANFAKFCKILAGSFSAVSKRNFARKYVFDSIFQALQDLHTFAPLQSQHFRKKKSV